MIDLLERKAALIKERDDFVMQANQRIAFLNGQLDLIEQILISQADKPNNGQVPAEDITGEILAANPVEHE